MIPIIQAKPQYLSDIYEMVIELATYEGIQDKIKITEYQLGKLLFCDQPIHFAGMAVINKNLIGLVLFNFTHHNICVNVNQGIYIENLYVSPEFRKQNIGKSLFNYVACKVKANDCSRIEWWVSRNNTEACNFYSKMGGIALPEWTIYKCDRSGIDNLLTFESI